MLSKIFFKSPRNLSIVPGHSFGQAGEHFGTRVHLGMWGEILAPGTLLGMQVDILVPVQPFWYPGGACLDIISPDTRCCYPEIISYVDLLTTFVNKWYHMYIVCIVVDSVN